MKDQLRTAEKATCSCGNPSCTCITCTCGESCPGTGCTCGCECCK